MTSHRERIESCLAGVKPDRTPVALWRHFPVDDQSPSRLAAAHLAFQKTFDFDLVKVTPSSSFCLMDWGAQDIWEGSPEGTRRYSHHVITDITDWAKLSELDPLTAPHLSAQLDCLRQIRAGLGPDTPMLQTIFNPLAQAKNLAGEKTLLEHLHKEPEQVLKGLKTISQTTIRFIAACRTAGIDGIFYAVQHAQESLLSREEFNHWSFALDMQILESASDLWCNMLHLHGEEVYFDLAERFPLQIVNWHDRETPPTLADAQKSFKGVVCGGLSRDTLVYQTAREVSQEAEDAIAQTNGKRLILSTGCVVPIIAPYGNLIAVRQR